MGQTKKSASLGLRRRDVVAGMALGIAALLRPRGFRGDARAEAIGAGAPPRYWVHIIATGGIDTVYTTDPRARSDVAPGVDVPYPADKIVTAGNLTLGPHFAALAPLADRLTVVNGVLVRTANHYTGLEQSARMRTKTTMRTPGVFELIGAHRDSQALASVTLNATLRQAHTAGFFGSSARGDFGGGAGVLELLDRLDPERKRDLASALHRRLRSLERRGAPSPAQAVQIDNMNQVRELLRRTAEIAPVQVTPWLDGKLAAADKELELSPDLQRALWFLEHDLTATITIFLGNMLWDTHAGNAKVQAAANPLLAALLARFFAELAARSNRHGRLADRTAVMVTSEIGRFPYINDFGGKDHFPQISVLLSGPSFPGGSRFGATGKEMEALPVDARTGRAAHSGDRLILDDVARAMLRAANLRPDAYAVPGRDLRFLSRVEAG